MKRFLLLARFAFLTLLVPQIGSALTFTPVITVDPNTPADVQQQQQQATAAALNRFASYFSPSNISVRAEITFKDLGNTGTLGQGGPGSFQPLNSVYFAQALYDWIAKNDVNGGGVSLSVQINTNSSIKWFYGTAPVAGQYSWQDVVMHELGHAMGFIDTVNKDGSFSNAGPSVFETLSIYNSTPISSLDQPTRAQAVISNSVFWSGQFATAANKGAQIKLYAPNPYEEGSNFSHIDPSQPGIAGLYYPALTDNVFFPGPTAQELGIFKDIGWATIPSNVQLVNISTRVVAGTGDQVGIGGFIVRGNQQKKVLIRGIGPSLTSKGVAGALADPFLELRDSAGNLILSNDNWRSNQEAEINATGAPPSDDRESALIATLDAGKGYTAILKGSNGASGVGLVEIFDLQVNSGPDLANISTRGQVLTNENIMIGGFILQGVNPQTIVVRALGPSLTAAGVSGALADPTLEVRDAQGTLLIANDNWKDDPSQANALTANKIAPTRDEEAAVIVNAPAGSYTAQVRGKSGSSGVGLVEVYNIGTTSSSAAQSAPDNAVRGKPLNPAGLRW